MKVPQEFLASIPTRILSNLGRIGCKRVYAVHILPLSWIIVEHYGPAKYGLAQPLFRFRFPKSDRRLIHQGDIGRKIKLNRRPDFVFHLQVASHFGRRKHFAEFFRIFPPHFDFRPFCLQ
jgi:hypothetical protein